MPLTALTAIYILMIYARIRGLFRKAGIDVGAIEGLRTVLNNQGQEIKLIKKIASIADVWQGVEMI